jgi:hypothetical protein
MNIVDRFSPDGDNLGLLSAEILGARRDNRGCVIVPRNDYLKWTKGFPAALRARVNQLIAEVHLVIPADFIFCFFFDARGTTLIVGFQDGLNSREVGSFLVSSRQVLMRQLSEIEWDEKRFGSRHH